MSDNRNHTGASSSEQPQGRKREGCLDLARAGMVMRLCFDLGLHVNCTTYVKAGVLTSADVRARQSTFWSCVVLNQYVLFFVMPLSDTGLHFGRPFRIDSGEITVQSPSNPGNNRAEGYQPQEGPTRHQPDVSMMVLKEWVFPCETLVPLIRTLYGSSSTPITTLQEVSSSVTCQLEARWQALPGPLQVQAELLLLHMAYYHFQILIHRLWTSRRSSPRVGQNTAPRYARRVCSTSATAISRLLIQYEQGYSFGHMHNYTVNIIFPQHSLAFSMSLRLRLGPLMALFCLKPRPTALGLQRVVAVLRTLDPD